MLKPRREKNPTERSRPSTIVHPMFTPRGWIGPSQRRTAPLPGESPQRPPSTPQRPAGPEVRRASGSGGRRRERPGATGDHAQQPVDLVLRERPVAGGGGDDELADELDLELQIAVGEVVV